ncbi:hypothetical protein [Nesterenkonia pannonica]|uniref:hypothetical protein n=1 Tax=Nesterenkonia pannonica TaxID=1548602 RepID=UPI0021648791|nr:hypothetical protein [Nesterenkonia pannonica]
MDIASILAESDSDTHIYCCGPESLLDAVEQAASHWPAGSLHVERFANHEVLAKADDHTFEVELAEMGKTIAVEPGVSILDAAGAA